ncbi:MAG: methionyl-tRNA formyltransferase [Proteobacteria bacterium]|nr:methionyl-tRNA formyltransferase [Pseudomonadota bacterium]MBS0462321.1 methionyl-tRNA formyltransferase [Pseudomonadota bacterium]
MRIVFAGTPEFALPSLRAAARFGQVVAVYTQPDRPAGRGRQPTPSPVKQMALHNRLEVRQPVTLRTPAERHTLAELKPDLMIVVAYGLLLPPKILAIPRHGCWNVHASLLPRWRGAAPIQRAIEAGDAQTGVCLMRMDEGLDTGPVLLSLPTPIDADDTGGSLHNRLAELGAEVLSDGLTLLRAGMRPAAQPQPSSGATYARKLEKSEARLDWNLPAEVLARKVRAFDPWPVAEGIVDGERLRIHQAKPLAVAHSAVPGSVLAATRDGIDIACAQDVLRLLVVQREGGRALPVGDYLNAKASTRA